MDESVQPPFESTVAMDLRVSNFGMRGQPTYFEIDSWSDPALDLLRISGKSLADGQTLHATATLTMRGLHPRRWPDISCPWASAPSAPISQATSMPT